MTADFSELRVKMVDGQLRTTDVTNLPLLTAMLSIPREAFVPDSRKALAYIDENILISEKAGPGARYLMKPSPFAKMVQLAEIGPDDKVLDVGTGTGYSAAVLSGLAKSVSRWKATIRSPTRRHRRLPALAATMFRSCAASSRPATRPARPMMSLSSKAASMSFPKRLQDSLPKAVGWSWSWGTAQPAWRAST
jgi:phage-related protein